MEALPEAINGRARVALKNVPDVIVHDIYSPLGAKLYDAIALQDGHELREMIAIARQTTGPILELACGAGRFTLALLALGRQVTAVDLSPSMLAILSDRLDSSHAHLRGNLTMIEGDICDFDPGRRFNTVIFGCVTVSLLDSTARGRLFRHMGSVLSADGRFFLSTTVAEGDTDLATPGTPIENLQQVLDSAGTAYCLHEYIAADRSIRAITLIPEVITPGAPVDVFTTAVRVLPPDQLMTELQANELEVIRTHPVKTPGAAHEIVILEVGHPA
ncbi:daptide-type RiPP biosynthesis methyltransferase [Arthrobacter sp. MA-N2]|uniref:daptide-type RiPP biosynthesis methyltransferase n=1 Tax=Arthrobacter sp. MA-N2 TaxID=1101188 RepID=UPI0004B5A711|nr:daptide-type RiPP biosynthesis methyltransferase [Arthrobacter sp. MA-N2]